MFFDNVEDIQKLAEKFGCTVFVVPNELEIKIKNAFELCPGATGKTGITIDQVRELLSHLKTKENNAKYIIIKQAEMMNEEAANSFLKNLEEPKENYHFILQTQTPSVLLPTILSRSELFILRQNNPLDSEIKTDANTKEIAKKLIIAAPKDLPKIADEITKIKDDARAKTLIILETAIEMCYKSYFKTNNQLFIKKLPKLINTYDHISRNGHIKTHLVADML